MMGVIRTHIFLVVLLAMHKVRNKTSFSRPCFFLEMRGREERMDY